MSRPGTSAPPVRSRLVRASAVAAAAVAVASLAHGELVASSRRSASQTADPALVLAPKVASSSTPTAILIRVTAPLGQVPGVVYTVTRVTRRGTTTVCAGRAPLRCTDPVGTPGTAVSYTVSSTLDGGRTATTSVDVATAPRPARATVVHRAIPAADDAGPAPSSAGARSADKAQAAAPALEAASTTVAASGTAPTATTSAAVSTSGATSVATSPADPTASVTATDHDPSASKTHTTVTTSADGASPVQTTASDAHP